MDWIKTSYMGRLGLAKGARGSTHALTEAVQGEYKFVYGPYAEPVLRIRPGDVVAAETHDAFHGAIRGSVAKLMLRSTFPLRQARPTGPWP